MISARAVLVLLAVAVEFSNVASAVEHPAFKGAGKEAGLQIWRIENFEPVPVKATDFGTFYEGDSYIVLLTKEDEDEKLSWDIFYWLGSQTTQDEYGAAAILAVQLDDSLSGAPVQHREVQGHESSGFLACFNSGVRYLPGGVASGFNHVEINAPGEKRLYHVIGKKNIRVLLVEPTIKSMNKADCFILDTGKDVYVYVGSEAKAFQKLRATTAANQIKDQDHHGRAKVYIVDASSTSSEVAEFFKQLGSGSPSEIPDAPKNDGIDLDKAEESAAVLYKVSEAGGKLVTEKIGEKPLNLSMLKPGNCFILDTGSAGIYVWIGRGSTTQQKVEALKKGQEFLAENKYPAWTSMTRVVQGAEPLAFMEYFGSSRSYVRLYA